MRRSVKGFRYIFAILLTVGILLTATFIGSSGISPLDIFSILFHKLFGTALPEHIPETAVTILWTLRLPRVLVAFFVGGALAASGCVVQSVLKNPLATPYTLGVSSGASLGAGITIVTGVSIPFLTGFTLPLVGFLSALATVGLVLVFSSRVDRNMSNMTVILAGMVFSLFFSAVLTVLTALSSDHHMQQITMWQMGSFSMRGWSYLQIFLPFFLVGTALLLFYSRELDIMTFGEETASSMGVNTFLVKRAVFVCAAILTGSAVAICGTIGFVDLIAPHLVRRWFGSKHKIILPMSIVTGGCLMVLADLIARTLISPSELPVGAVTAIIGAPFFAYVYFKKMK